LLLYARFPLNFHGIFKVNRTESRLVRRYNCGETEDEAVVIANLEQFLAIKNPMIYGFVGCLMSNSNIQEIIQNEAVLSQQVEGILQTYTDKANDKQVFVININH
jgi:hypothetical protein